MKDNIQKEILNYKKYLNSTVTKIAKAELLKRGYNEKDILFMKNYLEKMYELYLEAINKDREINNNLENKIPKGSILDNHTKLTK